MLQPEKLQAMPMVKRANTHGRPCEILECFWKDDPVGRGSHRQGLCTEYNIRGPTAKRITLAKAHPSRRDGVLETAVRTPSLLHATRTDRRP
ncbi:unnamed protein product [Penicillium camemberti]|uniref:Str. FM013 n=1 Tax=Penicillium camemberti (strain FM 013) TaxID=1429867 RepID=A0A0G4PA74_PENC3|nr:unnamed protein product [Penicillium camemberti]